MAYGCLRLDGQCSIHFVFYDDSYFSKTELYPVIKPTDERFPYQMNNESVRNPIDCKPDSVLGFSHPPLLGDRVKVM